MSYIFSNKKLDEILEKYRKDHECCPKCKSIDHISTLKGYVLDYQNVSNFRYFDLDIAAGITTFGQLVIKTVEQEVVKRMKGMVHTVVEDTDSTDII